LPSDFRARPSIAGLSFYKFGSISENFFERMAISMQ